MPRHAHIPIIMITSRTAEKHRSLARELGVDLYLGKPFQEEELLRNLREMLALCLRRRIGALARVGSPHRRRCLAHRVDPRLARHARSTHFRRQLTSWAKPGGRSHGAIRH